MVRKLPRVPSSAIVAAILNLTIRKRLSPLVLERLAERPFAIEVRDLRLTMAFHYAGRKFVPVPAVPDAALRFRLDSSDFATLAADEDDPGTSFLRELVIVGDPDIADGVRRSLKGMDVARARRLLRRALRHVERELERE